jgi:hypothetical protein
MKGILSQLSATVIALTMGVASAQDPLHALQEKISIKRETAVLFVGNSYSFGAPKAFRKLAEQKGKKVRVDQVTTGGWTLAKHSKNDATLRRIREGHWDIVVFQEQSRIPSLSGPQRSLAMNGPLNKLVEAARENGSVPVLYQTWGYRDGDKKRKGDDFHAMTDRVRDGYRTAAIKAGDLAVIPVGDAWQREVKAGRGNQLFMPDGSHPTNAGNALTAKVFYDMFFPSREAGARR